MNQAPKRPTIVTRPCISSQLAAWGYDPVTKTLQVDFIRGASYQYDSVPQEIADGMTSAKSIGQYFGQAVRGKFKTHKLG